MKTLKLRVPEATYYDLVAQAAQEQKDVDEFAKEQLASLVGDSTETTDSLSFKERVIEEFDLDPGTKTAANVIGVAERMREGMTWVDAYTDRAQKYAAENPEIDDPAKYADTVRDCCTRRINLDTGEFRQRVADLIEEYDETNDSADSKFHPTWDNSSQPNSYIVKISGAEDVLATFGQDPTKDQSEVMKAVVDYLIEDHDLISQILIPYTVEKKALVNESPTYPDGDETMRHYKELSNGYYLDTHYKKEDKMKRLQDLAGECGLGITFGDRWERR